MALIKSNRLKIAILVLTTLLIFIGWQNGFEVFYARVLTFGTNAVLGVIKKDNHIELEKINNKYHFKIQTRIDGRRASYSQVFGGLLQPFVIILSWQLMIWLVLKRKEALYSTGINFGIFYLLHIIFLILLTGFHASEIQKFIYIMFMDSFYILALVLVIKDNMLYPVFRKT